MTTFPEISPTLKKGSIIAIDQVTKQRTQIEFQYNPETLTRRLTAQAASGGSDRSEALRLKGPPVETISFDAEIDATDQLEVNDGDTTSNGIHARLAILELLLYPLYKLVIENENLAYKGIIEIIPPEAPLTLFSWSKNGQVPFRLTSRTITEEEFDPMLNPLRAKVSLELTVLSYMDLGLPSEGGQTFMTHQQLKEQMARNNKPGRSNS